MMKTKSNILQRKGCAKGRECNSLYAHVSESPMWRWGLVGMWRKQHHSPEDQLLKLSFCQCSLLYSWDVALLFLYFTFLVYRTKILWTYSNDNRRYWYYSGFIWKNLYIQKSGCTRMTTANILFLMNQNHVKTWSGKEKRKECKTQLGWIVLFGSM